MTAADRQRAYRARVRKGEVVLRVRVRKYSEAVEALIANGALSSDEALHRENVAREIEAVFSEWVRLWTAKNKRYA
jgi:hypothetical protein